MKKNIITALCFILWVIFINPVFSAEPVTFKLVVLSTDIVESKENYYAFPEASDIITSDIADYFKNSDRIKIVDLSVLKKDLNENISLKSSVYNAMRKYRNSNSIDYTVMKMIAEKYDAKSVLLVSSYVTTDKNSARRGLWEILQASSDFNIQYPFVLETHAILIDTYNDLVMRSCIYKKNITDKKSMYNAQNYIQASSQLENMRMYSKDILAPSISQNVTLKFFPKSIREIDLGNIDTGEAPPLLRFNRGIPQDRPQKTDPVIDPNSYDEMIFGL